MANKFIKSDIRGFEQSGRTSLKNGETQIRMKVPDLDQRKREIYSTGIDDELVRTTANTLSRAIWVNYWKQTRPVTDIEWSKLINKRIDLYNSNNHFRTDFDSLIKNWIISTEHLLTCPLGFTLESLEKAANKYIMELDRIGIRNHFWGNLLFDPLKFQRIFFPIIDASRSLNRVPVSSKTGTRYIKSYCVNRKTSKKKNAKEKTRKEMLARDKDLKAISSWYVFQIAFLNKKYSSPLFSFDIASVAQQVFDTWLRKNFGLRYDALDEYENSGCNLFAPMIEDFDISINPSDLPQTIKSPKDNSMHLRNIFKINEVHNKQLGPLMNELLIEKNLWSGKRGGTFDYVLFEKQIRVQLSRHCEIREALASFEMDFT